MSNSYYNHSAYPAPNAPGSSAALRAELDLVTAGFAKLPTLAGNGYKVAMVSADESTLIASSALQALTITQSFLDSTPIGTTTRAAGNFTTLTANSTVNLGNTVIIGGGTIDNAIIGGTTRAAAYFTTVSANSGFTGNLTGNVTGNVAGNVTGNITGNVTGNVTATTGSSTFNDVSITGTLDMNSGTTGTITGLSTPTNSTDAATKGYTDTQDALKLSLTGGTMSGAIAMGTNRITGLGDPVNPQDAATKAYVDATAQGLDIKASVKVATTANITLSGTQTIDGVAVAAGDRVLVKDQSTQSTNGIYVAAAGAWSRSSDMDVWTEFPGSFFFVEQGTTNADSGWVCTVDQGGTLGSTSVTFQQFSGAGQITAGAGLTKTGNTLDVGTASSTRIVVNADNIDLATTGVGAGTYKSVTVDLYGRVTAGTNPTTLAGYGITDAYTKAQIDTTVATLLPLAGGTMSGNIAMGNNKVTGLATPSAGTDATNKTYVDGILGSATAAATSAAAAAASALAASNSQTAASNSQTAAATSETNAAASAAAAALSYDSFDDRYLGAKSIPPTVDNDGNALLIGALYFDTTLNSMRVWTSGGWIATGSSVNGTSQRYKYVATAGQTTFSGVDANGATLAYDAGYVDVYLNGSRLDTSDFTASSGTSIVLGAACAAGDTINIVAFGTFSIATHVLKSGDTMTGLLTVPSLVSTGNVGIGTISPSANLAVYETTAPVIALQNSTTGQTSSDGLQFYVVGSTAYVDFKENGSLNFWTNGAERLRLDASGNLGLGIAPSVWASAFPAFQIGYTGALSGRNGTTEAVVLSSNYYNNSGAKYIGTGYSTMYEQYSGAHYWSTAPSGTAGTAITFTQAMTLDASGRLLIGTTSSRAFGGFGQGSLQVETAVGSALATLISNRNDTGASVFGFGKSRGTTTGSVAAVTSGDPLGTLNWSGADGTNLVSSSSIFGAVDAAVSTGIVPGRLVFSTANTSGTLAERMRIDSSGNVGIGTNSPKTKVDNTGSFRSTGVNDPTSGAGLELCYRSGVADVLSYNRDTSQFTELQVRGSPIAFYNANGERARIDSSGNWMMNSGYGSVATAYGCRAWVNFNGTGTVAIRGSGNVSSITDNGVGDYTVNFANAMPDANYSAEVSAAEGTTWSGPGARPTIYSSTAITSGSIRVVYSSSGSLFDVQAYMVSIFR